MDIERERERERETDSYIIIVGNCNTQLRSINTPSRKKTNQETLVSSNIIHEMDLIDIYKTLHLKRAEYTYHQMHMKHSSGFITC